ncbi:MAG: HAMP domain-containing protein [Propionibacteriales bacterium]|nr:HAMP domain-containing protein [Propionibacteriales bacterium]
MARSVLRSPAESLRALRSFWRRSLQWRVVISTLLLAGLVVALVGWMLLRQVTEGLLESKREQALSEAAAGFKSAQDQLDAADLVESDARALLSDLVNDLNSRGEASGLHTVVLQGPVEGTPGSSIPSGSFKDAPVDVDSVPEDLENELADRNYAPDEDGSLWSYTRLRYEPGVDRESVPALAVGSLVTLPVGGTSYMLVFLFPLDEQQDTVSVVRGAILTAGSLLVLLVGGVVYLVIRQVVTPVGLARRIAERLAAGRLEERMLVRGEDDLARLGTSFNQMASSLQRQIRRLEELSRVQRRFVSDVSHELRTPLATVRMAADVLHEARDQFDGATARSAELLQDELDRFETLLRDLLEISRFDAGAVILDLETVDLTEVARQVVAATETLAARHGARFVLTAPEHPCTAQADIRRIERIVRNLVSNAIEYGEGADVEVTVAASQDAAALTVRDHGAGLRPGETVMVFNRFWRADPARTRTKHGSGLGLAISLEDARLHGGWLEAWGEPGHGAQFRLTLPRAAGEPMERSPLPLVPADAALPGAGVKPVPPLSGIGGS